MGAKHMHDGIMRAMRKRLKGFRLLPHWMKVGLHHMNPSWFSCVMGTGILAICMMLSPLDFPWVGPVATMLWIVDVVLLTVLLLFWSIQCLHAPTRVQASLHHFSLAQSWGTPPMACFTVASGFVLIGAEWFDASLCVLLAQILWLNGVLGSIFCALAIPYLMFTHYELTVEQTYGSWLLPVVPLIGSAVPGSLLIPYWPRGLHLEMLALNYALLGTGMMLAAIVIVLFYSRLAYHKVPHGSFVPTFWMVIGPLGQSATAVMALGKAADVHLPLLGDIVHKTGFAYGLLAWGFGIYWLILAIMVTLRAARRHLPFNLGWWSFVYPVGVMTTGTYALHEQMPTQLFLVGGAILLLLLAGLWVLVAVRTVRHLWYTARTLSDETVSFWSPPA